MKRVALALFGIGVLSTLCLLAYAHWPSTPLPPGTVADRVLVLKGQRRLILFKGGEPLKEYRVSLGARPVGCKEREGDKKTPEGLYTIDYRNPESGFHLSLHISYPNADDRIAAKEMKVPPGSLIMIHGMKNGLGFVGRLHRHVDWTGGCIALTDAEIEELWDAVKDGTPVEIRP